MLSVRQHTILVLTALVFEPVILLRGCRQDSYLSHNEHPSTIVALSPKDPGLCPSPPVTPDPGPWAEYTDASFGIRFKYPANWEVSRRPDEDAYYIVNVSNCLKGHEHDTAVIRIEGHWKPMVPFSTLSDYLQSEERMPAEQLISQDVLEMPLGHEAISRLWWGEGKNITIFLAHAGLVISVMTRADSRYVDLAEVVARTIEQP